MRKLQQQHSSPPPDGTTAPVGAGQFARRVHAAIATVITLLLAFTGAIGLAAPASATVQNEVGEYGYFQNQFTFWGTMSFDTRTALCLDPVLTSPEHLPEYGETMVCGDLGAWGFAHWLDLDIQHISTQGMVAHEDMTPLWLPEETTIVGKTKPPLVNPTPTPSQTPTDKPTTPTSPSPSEEPTVEPTVPEPSETPTDTQPNPTEEPESPDAVEPPAMSLSKTGTDIATAVAALLLSTAGIAAAVIQRRNLLH